MRESVPKAPRSRLPLAAALAAALAACGGSGGGALTVDQRAQAAAQTAGQNPSCTPIQPFYWEIGDQGAALAGATASGTGATAPAAGTALLIASASKWIFGAYVVQLRGGALPAAEVAALTMRSGYANLSYAACLKLIRANQDAETVHDCFTAAHLAGGRNDDLDAAAVGKFEYNGGHFQSLADGALGLGAADNAALKSAIAAQVGSDFSFGYDSPQLAAGVQTTGRDYGAFLRKILGGKLLIHDFLGANAVCTNPATCADAIYAPLPSAESWHYSLGHWVEDDPAVGDGAFSSPGAFGFYPWIDSSKTYYGVMARYATASSGSKDPVAVDSVLCGRKIRKAWLTGAAVVQ